MNCDKLFKVIDELREKYLDILEDVCNIESHTIFKEGVDKVGNYLINVAKSHDWKIEICKQEVSGDAVCITLNPDAEGEPVSILGHIDTVHPVGLFGTPAVKRDSEKTTVPGCSCEIEQISLRPAMEYTKRNEKLLEKMNEIYKESGLPVLKIRPCLSGSDAAYTTEAGIPSVDSIGAEGENIHSINEFIYLNSIPECAKRIASFIYCI